MKRMSASRGVGPTCTGPWILLVRPSNSCCRPTRSHHDSSARAVFATQPIPVLFLTGSSARARLGQASAEQAICQSEARLSRQLIRDSKDRCEHTYEVLRIFINNSRNTAVT
jgi:hypothetical protein